MEKYKVDPRDTLEQNYFSGCLKEEFVRPAGDFAAPFYASRLGITLPDKDYFISRTVCSQIILEYVVSGKGYVECNGKREAVGSGDVYLLLPESKHSYGADMHNPYKKIWINFSSDIFLNFIYAYSLNEQTVYHVGDGFLPEFERLISTAETQIMNDNVQIELSKIVYSILAGLVPAKNNAISPSNAFTKRVHEVLNGQIYGKPKIKELAEKLCVSESYLIRQFKADFGTTPYQFLLNKKIETAKKLLSFTNKNISKIAEELGFDNEHYFSDIFKQKVGSSPSSYRKENSV